MFLLGKSVDQLEANDIKRLVENQIAETKTLDYKRELKLEDKDKKEFLFDIASMYNTDGGCLIYGIEERKDENNKNTGIPEKIIGIAIDNLDQLFQKIEDVLKSNTDPSISSVSLKPLQVDGKDILVIGVRKGFGLPSMVTYNETNKFYRRRNSGKYAVDVYELNRMFMQNQILKEATERFRQERIEKVIALKVFSTLETKSSLFIQIIPFSFQDEQFLDLTNANNSDLSTIMRPLNCSGWDTMFNLDGYATFGGNRQKIISYDQLFRNGIYEAYTGQLIESYSPINGPIIDRISGAYFVKNVVDKLADGFKVLKTFRIEPPYVICISIHGMRGAVIFDLNTWSKNPITVTEIILPPLLLLNIEVNLRKTLKPHFDIIWQAAGYSESPAYHE